MPSLSRRSLLVAPWAYPILKPFIDCVDARADTPKYEPCFIVLYKTEGQYVGADHGPCAANWLPKAGPNNQPGVTGPLTAMSPILEPLTPVMDLTSVVGGFRDKAQENSGNDYHHSNPNIFTGASYANQKSPPRFESLHWYVADRWKTEPLLLSPGWVKGYASIVDSHTGFRRVNNDIRLTTPIGQPMDAFRSVFGNVMGMAGLPTDKTEQSRQLARRGLMDFLLADSKRVMAASSAEHKIQIERHIDGLQTLSRKIGTDVQPGMPGAPVPATGTCTQPGAMSSYGDNPDNKSAYNKGLLAASKDLHQVALAAMRCGLRRVVGYDLVAEGPGDKFWPMEWDASLTDHVGGYGKEGGYHFEYWHWGTGPGNLKFDWMVRVEKYIMQTFFAPLLIGMKETGTPDNNLLKASLGVYGTQQTYNHGNYNHSFLVFGSLGGKFKPQRSLMYRDIMKTQFEAGGRNINDFLLSVVQTMGFPATTYGDAGLCSGPLPDFAG